MIPTIIAFLPVLLLLGVSELLWRSKILKGEVARKSLHIIIGSYVAVWPIFLTFEYIEILSVCLFVGVALSHYFKIFHAILDIRRRSWGDLYYAVGIGITAFISNNPWIFSIAMLHMSLGDGFAGLIGNKFGKKNRYKIFGQTKSIIGSATFYFVSLLILLILAPYYTSQSLGLIFLTVPLVATLTENIGIRGSDNILVPLSVVLMLNMYL
ncbi:hypothetical protein KDA11_06570 [Candidatus Saccharibacteria bacterium]|nr:hypothetical protein [Candidatus Saccharibacteria bacterium]